MSVYDIFPSNKLREKQNGQNGRSVFISKHTLKFCLFTFQYHAQTITFSQSLAYKNPNLHSLPHLYQHTIDLTRTNKYRTSMTTYSNCLRLFLSSALLLFCTSSVSRAETAVPAMYVFGDSLVDVGNNNYLSLSIIKADFPYNGLDFPGSKATGRFCNGKNAADHLGV